MTFLQIVQSLINELGLSGVPQLTGITNGAVVQGSPGYGITEVNNAIRWVHDGCLDIDNQWLDWRYHWQQYNAAAVAANSQTLPAPSGGVLVQSWDPNKVRFRATTPGGATWQPSDFYPDRGEFLDCFDVDNAVPGSPVAFTLNPDNSVFFCAPFDQAYDFKGEFWQRPFELSDDSDVPLMPAQYHRMIMCRAAVMYGNREDAPEIIQGLEAEYIQFQDKLQSDQLEAFQTRRQSTDRQRPQSHRHLHRFMQ